MSMHLDGAWRGYMLHPCILLLRFLKRFSNYHQISWYSSASSVRQIEFVVAIGAVAILPERIMQMQAQSQLVFGSLSASPHQLLLLISKETLLFANAF